jgi:hypothetical protein
MKGSLRANLDCILSISAFVLLEERIKGILRDFKTDRASEAGSKVYVL